MSVRLLRILLFQKGFNRIIARVVQTSGLCSPVCCFQQLPIVVSRKDYDQDKDLVIKMILDHFYHQNDTSWDGFRTFMFSDPV